MYNFKRGAAFIASNPFLYILSILVAVLCMTGVSFIFNYVSGLTSCLNLINFNDEKDLVYIVENYKTIDIDETKLKGIFRKSFATEGRFIDGEYCFDYVAYDRFLAKNVKIELKKGKWFTDVESKDGEVNAVIAKNDEYSVGDLITINNSTISELRIRITGVLPKSFEYVAFGAFSVPSDMSMILKRYDGNRNSDYFLIFVDDDLGSKNPASYMYVFDNVSESERNENTEYLRNFASVANLEEMRDGSRREIKTTLEAYLPTIVLSILLFVASSFAISFITVENNKKNLSVLRFCGAKRKDIFAVIASYVFVVFVPSIILFGIINAVVYDKLSGAGLIASPIVFSSVIAGYFSVMTVISITTAHYAEKNISRIIKED